MREGVAACGLDAKLGYVMERALKVMEMRYVCGACWYYIARSLEKE